MNKERGIMNEDAGEYRLTMVHSIVIIPNKFTLFDAILELMVHSIDKISA